jgi:hypothetical protein
MEKFCLKINSICKSLLQGVIASEMPKMLLFTTQRTLGPKLYLYMNLWLEFDNCQSVAPMVIALYRQRRVTGLTPARVPIHVAAFSATGLDFGPTIISG